jgi:hypothetical protein
LPSQSRLTLVPRCINDVSMASAHIALACTWVTHIRLNNDHLPITITLPTDDASPTPRKVKSYTNFNKADWPAFIRETDTKFRELPPPTSVEAGEKDFRDILLKASSHCIPSGYRHLCIPGISCEAASLINQCDAIRAIDPLDLSFVDLNYDINKIIAENRRQIWREKGEETGQRAEPSKFWLLLWGLSGKRQFVPPNQPIWFGKNIHT